MQSDLECLLRESIGRHRLPGATVAVFKDGALYEAAAGVVNTTTGVPCTPDTLFMFGSVTKTVTATMALRLIDQGLLSLDDLAADRVPEFSPAQPGLADAIRIRHLLTHTSGLIGSIFQDTGRDSDALAKQIALINRASSYHAPGALLSYCNSGYLLLGRAIEVATGVSWDDAVRTLIAKPLASKSIVTRPEHALRFSTAVGHVIDPTVQTWVPIPEPFANAGHGPAGSTMAGCARDLVQLATAYLNGEPAVVRPATAQTAWSVQALPLAPSSLSGWGHGWMVFDWNGKRIIGHDGSTPGTKAYVRVAPEHGLVVALMVNAQAGFVVYEDVVGAIFRAHVGAWETTAEHMPHAPVSAIAKCIGAYEDSHLRLEVSVDGDQARVAIMPNATNPIHRPVLMSYPVHPCGEDAFYATGAGVIFYPPANDLTTTLVRLSKRVMAADGVEYLCNGANVYRRAT